MLFYAKHILKARRFRKRKTLKGGGDIWVQKSGFALWGNVMKISGGGLFSFFLLKLESVVSAELLYNPLSFCVMNEH